MKASVFFSLFDRHWVVVLPGDNGIFRFTKFENAIWFAQAEMRKISVG